MNAISIFNDVIGPVMRGPSSSHCAAALRIGRLARDMMDADIQEVLVEFDHQGSLPTTHESQGSDMGLFGGLMGWDAADERLPSSAKALSEAGVRVRIETVDSGDKHPNTYRLTLRNAREQHSLIAISTGGGMMEVISVDGFKVSMSGDCYETLFLVEPESGGRMPLARSKKIRPPEADTHIGTENCGMGSEAGGLQPFPPSLRDGRELVSQLAARTAADEILLHESANGQLVEVKAGQFVSEAVVAELRKTATISQVNRLSPVLPVLSRRGMKVPFTTCDEMLRHDAGRNTPLWKLAVEYEKARGNLTEAEIMGKMVDIVRVLRRSIKQGIAGTRYDDRILGHQSGKFDDMLRSGRLLECGALNRIVLYVTALMEVKSAMGVIVAAPTAGACAALPGAVLAMADEMKLTEEEMAKAMLAGGLVGVCIATRWTFAAEAGGCQAECGSAASMAAAGLVTLAHGTLAHALAAASMALQNMLGLVCDPVASRVEVPCLGKNVLAASNALSCANMALAEYDPVIPLDEVIEAASRVGGQMPRELRCTALGGLSITKTSRALESELAAKKRPSPPAHAGGKTSGC